MGGIQDTMTAVSQVSTKGVNLQSHEQFLNVYLQHYDTLWEEYTKERWSRNRMSLYGGKQRVWDEFFNEISSHDPEKEVIIAYGASKFNPTGKGELSVPTSQVYKETLKRFKQNVHLVDEYRSTKVFYKDDSILQSVTTRQNRSRALRGLLWCGSTIINRPHFVDRDLNAALNIRRCLMEQRPVIMTRSTSHRKLPKVIGKIIKR
jgi:transposase